MVHPSQVPGRPGEGSLQDISDSRRDGTCSTLPRSREPGAALEVVTGKAPSLADPWSRARRIRVIRKGLGPTVLRDAATGARISPVEIQAARLVTEDAP